MKTFKERVESLKEEKRELEEDICSRAEEICNLANEYYPSGREYCYGRHFTEVSNIFTDSQDFMVSYDYYNDSGSYTHDTFIHKKYFEKLIYLD